MSHRASLSALILAGACMVALAASYTSALNDPSTVAPVAPAPAAPATFTRFSDYTKYCGCLSAEFGSETERRRKIKLNFCGIKVGAGVFQVMEDTKKSCAANSAAALAANLNSPTWYCVHWQCDRQTVKGKTTCQNTDGSASCDTIVPTAGGGSATGGGGGDSGGAPPNNSGGSGPSTPSTPATPSPTPAPLPEPSEGTPVTPAPQIPPAIPSAPSSFDPTGSFDIGPTYDQALGGAINDAMAQSVLMAKLYSNGYGADIKTQGGGYVPSSYTVTSAGVEQQDTSWWSLGFLKMFASPAPEPVPTVNTTGKVTTNVTTVQPRTPQGSSKPYAPAQNTFAQPSNNSGSGYTNTVRVQQYSGSEAQLEAVQAPSELEAQQERSPIAKPLTRATQGFGGGHFDSTSPPPRGFVASFFYAIYIGIATALSFIFGFFAGIFAAIAAFFAHFL